MKTITIGDIHGQSCWKQVNPDEYGKIIFTADYVDSRVIKSKEEEFTNLKEIIEFKKKYPNKVILLIGNHDICYMYQLFFGFCSGFSKDMFYTYHHLFTTNRTLFQVAYQYEDYIWSHAGITNKWVLHNTEFLHSEELGNLAEGERLNRLPETEKGLYILNQAGPDRNGSDLVSGPLWAHSDTLLKDRILGFKQIVGHSPKVHGKKLLEIKETEDIVFCDCLKNQYENNIPFTFYEKEM
jgi:hypothetical protein